VPTVSTIKAPLLLIASQVVTLMAGLDSPGSEIISAVLSNLADLLLFAFFPKFYLCLSIVAFTKVYFVSQGLIQ